MRRIWIMTGTAAVVMAVTTGAAGVSARAHPAGHGSAAGTLAGPAYTPAFGINNRGVIVGTTESTAARPSMAMCFAAESS